MIRRDTSIRTPRAQRGAVLIVTLIFLVALTLLGVSVMNTSQLEERMAANAQEVTQSFQSAETGLSIGYENPESWNPTNTVDQSDLPIASGIGRNDKVDTLLVQYIIDTKPPPGSLYDAATFGALHFDFRSVGESGSAIQTTLHGGGRRIVPKFGD